MKKRRRRKRGNRRGMLGITAVVCVLLISLTVQSKVLEDKNADYLAQKATLQKQIKSEKERSEDIAQLKEYMQTNDYVEEVAKDKLGLVYEDEIVFKPEN